MKILLATDGSECSEEAARFLTRLRLTDSDEISILHVISEIPYEDEYHAQIKRVIRRVAPQILSTTTDILKDVKARISADEAEGAPSATIVKRAVDAGADLIVMGARGVKGLKRFFLGSTTRGVALSSPVPVMVFKRVPWPVSGPVKILFATDGSQTAEDAAAALCGIPFPKDTVVTILNVVWSPVTDIPEKFALEIDDRVKAEVAEARTAEAAAAEKVLDQARASLAGRFAEVRTLTRFGDPSFEILGEEKTLEPDMVVVGCRGLRGIRGFMGSVSRRILDHAESSVFIAKTCAQT